MTAPQMRCISSILVSSLKSVLQGDVASPTANARSARIGRVEMWRGGLGQAYLFAAPFVWRCLTSLTVLRLHIPLIEPDVRISRIRLSDQVHPEGLRSFRSTQGFTRPMVS